MPYNNKEKQESTFIPANEFVVVHPVLDFYSGKAIVSIGSRWIEQKPSGTSDFIEKPYCILSDGDSFIYSKDELISRKLFHKGYLDVPEARWNFNNIHEFKENPSAPTFEELFKIIRDIIDYYMVFDNENIYSILSCFIIYTYFYPLFPFAPILQMWGEFQTGKTKICSLLDSMILNPINSANISSASVFRLIESRRATIILDESEDLLTSERSRDIRNMLLAGTGKSGETFRQEKGNDDKFSTRSYKVFSPKVIANITGIDIPAIQSRVIRITTVGTADRTKSNRDVSAEDICWEGIRDQLYRICLLRSEEVIEAKRNLKENELKGRPFKLWQGILTIASLVSNEVFDNLLKYAIWNKEYIESEIVEFGEDPSELLNQLIDLCGENKSATFTPDQMMQNLSDFNFKDKKDMAMKLRKFELATKSVRFGKKVARCYVINREKLLHIQSLRAKSTSKIFDEQEVLINDI